MSKTPYAIDWENREFIELVSANMKVLTEFLNKFGMLRSPLLSSPSVLAALTLSARTYRRTTRTTQT